MERVDKSKTAIEARRGVFYTYPLPTQGQGSFRVSTVKFTAFLQEFFLPLPCFIQLLVLSMKEIDTVAWGGATVSPSECKGAGGDFPYCPAFPPHRS